MDLDLSESSNLDNVFIVGNENLISINLQNEANENIGNHDFTSNPSLESICVDNIQFAKL